MNEVRYGSYTFKDEDGTLYQGAEAYRVFSPIGNELPAWQYKIPVIFRPRDYSVEADAFRRGAVRGSVVTLALREPGASVALRVDRFYLTAITGGKKLRDGQYLFYLEGVDLPGLLISKPHKGGVYSNTTFLDVIKEITGATRSSTGASVTSVYDDANGFPTYRIDNTIATSRVDGWLPYTEDARDNLRKLLQQANARFSDITITNISSGAPTEISAYDIYAGDEYADAQPIATCTVNEHSYAQLANTDAEEIVTVSGADNELIVFDKPYYDLQPAALIVESGANYAILSGTGTLTGKPYGHTVRQLSQAVRGGNAGSNVTIDNTLISGLNSSAMLARAVNYYSNAQTISNAFKARGDVMAGRLLQVEDPLGELVNAYIGEETVTFSGITKHAGTMIAGWSPINGSLFTQRIVLDSSGTLTVPAGATLMRLILIQGGKGGWGGYKGGNATNSTFGGPADQAGDGGEVGEGGSPGKVLVVDVEQADLAASYTVTVGAAGTAGAANHGEGTEGGHSSVTDGVTTYTSGDGEIQETGYVDAMTGDVYALAGNDGIYPGQPGIGSNHPGPYSINDQQTSQAGTTTTWNSGTSRTVQAGVHGGGGPAYGSDGGNAGTTYTGDGADAMLDGFNGYTVTAGSYGSGGLGGNGGGGGGATTDANVGGGSGGDGSVGGPAAAGAVIALFAFGDTPTPQPTVVDLLDANGEQLYDSYFERLRAQEE